MTHRHPASRPRAGFSLIEILVAMTILVIVLGGMSLLSAKTSERARLAETLAQRNYTIVQQMNRLNALTYDSLKTYTQIATYDTIPSGIPTIRFLRRDTTYYISGVEGTPPGVDDTVLIEAKVVIIPLTSVRRDTVYRDSIALRRRNPRLTSPLNY